MSDIAQALPKSARGASPARRRWQRLRARSSPLARKIIAFNLVGLGLMVIAILYMNQNVQGRPELLRDTLHRQADIVATALGHSHGDGTSMALDPGFFRDLVQSTPAVAALYDHDLQLVAVVVPSHAVIDAAMQSLAGQAGSSMLTAALQQVWDVLSGAALPEFGLELLSLLEGYRDVAARAVETRLVTEQTILDRQGQQVVVVAVPFRDSTGKMAAVLLSSIGGQIEAGLRADRERILQVFGVAAVVSIFLSVALASSIARPLREMAAASVIRPGSLSLASIDIPDYSARPDEVGDLSRAMRAMTAALLERIEANKAFAADVAHEIKNPLTSLRSAVETFDYAKDEDTRQTLLRVIREDVDRMNRLLTDISNASRLEADLVQARWQPLDLGAMLAGLQARFALAAEARDVQITLNLPPDLPAVRALETRLAQVFDNLMSNALSFVPDEGRIEISARQVQGGGIELRVADNGPGIPPENLEDVFARFYSARPESQFGDHSGLGLAISRQIVQAHGGTMVARNRAPGPGRGGNGDHGGAEFVVNLPA